MRDDLQRKPNRRSRFVGAALVWGLSLIPAISATPKASAQTFKTLYAFTGGADGGGPWGTPLLSGGILYQTTFYGGNSSANDAGTVFEFLTTTLTGSYLYQFAGQPFDGSSPMGGLITDGFGDFFGTTTQGGFSLRGTIYEISQGSEVVVTNFNGQNGDTPEGSLFIDAVGNLYGTTSNGGTNDSGTVFAFSVDGSFVQLYNFGDYKGDGIGPASSVLLHQGVLYGVTTEGGTYGWGTVFSVNVKTKAEAILYDFRGGPKGGTPVGGLALDGKGNLYGTASAGGSANQNAGNGVIFMLNIKSQQYTVVHTFTGADGSQPLAALVSDGQGNFYGTTNAGGAKGYGTVFELNSAGTLTTLYSFTNGTDGAYPYAGVTLDSSGNIYGAATRGGQYGWGTLFEITP
jgi:uncharacterized repeat protein (TIGR03803 family)